MGRKGGSKLSKGGCPGKSDMGANRVRKIELYRTQNTRYKNKIRRAKKRYGRCKLETLKKVISQIVEHRARYKKER